MLPLKTVPSAVCSQQTLSLRLVGGPREPAGPAGPALAACIVSLLFWNLLHLQLTFPVWNCSCFNIALHASQSIEKSLMMTMMMMMMMISKYTLHWPTIHV